MAFIYYLAKDILIYFWPIIKAVKKFNFVQFIKISGYFSNSICREKKSSAPRQTCSNGEGENSESLSLDVMKETYMISKLILE